MSDAIQQAITAMEWMLCDYEHLNTMGQPLSANWPQRVQAVKDAIAGLQAAQAQAGDGVNQQLLGALQKVESHLVATMEHIDHWPQNFKDHCWEQVVAARAAIAAAQEQK